MKKYQLAVFIGRFSPLHYGHQKVIDEALNISDKVLILIGSSDSARNLRNPFTYDERKSMIEDTYHKFSGRIKVAPLKDYSYNDQAWVEAVQSKIEIQASLMGWSDMPKKVCLIGHNKDNTSYYLKLFPTFQSVNVSLYDGSEYTDDGSISATIVRQYLFGETGNIVSNFVSPESLNIINDVILQNHIEPLCDEYNWIKKHKEQWKDSPYPPMFITTDAMVVQSGHVLLIKRGHYPQTGKYALAGGYLNPDETIIDGTIRELKEETLIDVPVKVLKGNIIKTKVFDNPHRSERGRIVTHCSLIQLPDNTRLPKVKGSDDAAEAFWMPLSKLNNEDFFEDHYHLIQNMKGYLT